MNALTQITNFGQWCIERYMRGFIRVIGDAESGYELSIPHETLEAAYGWLSARYDGKSGKECLDFMLDGILDMDFSPDGYAAKKLVEALDAPHAVSAFAALRAVRHHYASKAIEHHKGAIVDLHRGTPDPMDKRKDQIENRYQYPRLMEG